MLLNKIPVTVFECEFTIAYQVLLIQMPVTMFECEFTIYDLIMPTVVLLQPNCDICINNAPTDLQQVTRLYKGKGVKGKCSNERGITLASNFGKLFERIINNRITPKIRMTEAQAGGHKSKATVDHLLRIKDTIKLLRQNKKEAYIAFLDVTKAYDKAWLDAIIYVMQKEGTDLPTWKLVKELNSNLKATLKTKHGNTREIQIKDSIRQEESYQ